MFSKDYYSCCSANSNKKSKRWFCNAPLSPVPNTDNYSEIQNTTISSSESTSKQLNSSDIISDSEEENVVDDFNKDPNFNPDNDKSLIISDSEEENIVDDFNKHPNFNPDNDEIISDTDIDEDNVTTNALTNISHCSSTDSDDSIIPKQISKFSDSSNKNNKTLNATLGKIKNNGQTRKGNKGKDFCFFCEDYVLNFSRHIKRNHTSELEVQRIFSLSAGCKERKNLLAQLRKRGNYLNSYYCQKPLKAPILENSILPCSICLGFYSAKQLWRHKKRCINANEGEKACQSNAQNFLLKHLYVDKELKEKVFPRMRSDDISLLAKKDPLICAFAARYIKIHREKHFINVASRKMRELAKLFFEIKKLKPSLINLFEALKPKYFDLLVSATKTVAKYNIEKEYYESPTYALNIGTTLKQCCEIAIVYALKKKDIYATIKSAEAEADLRTLIQLIESHWRFEISSQAANDLNMNKWSKITIVPLASDLKLLKEFLIFKAESAINALSLNNNDKISYVILLETIFCRVILLNRRRPGELQRLFLHIYERTENNLKNDEEFSEIITPSERLLMKKFKRIVIRGKRGRGVPVLFSNDVQEHIKILLNYRENFVDKKNLYLFGNPSTIGPICGYKVLKKYAVMCGAKNPDAITATKLRKHLATLTQVFSMTENDIDQLATFMGHTLGVHKSSYRLPDDIYQTARITKLLLLMEKGPAAEYKGKPLNEINFEELDLNEDILLNEVNNETEEIVEPICRNDDNNETSLTEVIKKSNTKRIIVPWTKKQKEVVIDYFRNHIKKKKPPKKEECMILKEENTDLFINKDWLKIKVFVQNQYRKK